MPTYNEQATIRRAVDQVLSSCEADVLVVDDSSPDGTGETADLLAAGSDRVISMRRPAKAGLGSAYRAGMTWALHRGYDVVCEMDADLSHDAADLPRLIKGVDGAGLSIGSRYVRGGSVEGWPRHRLWLSRGGNWYVRMCTGMAVHDATAGFRAYRREVLNTIDLSTIRSEGYSFQIEMAIRTWRSGFRIVEVPITFYERREGNSKMSRAIIIEALWRTTRWGMARRSA